MYPGGKNGAGIFQRLICQIPPHRVYVEAFAGSAAILRHKRPAPSSVAIDVDGEVVEQLRRLPVPDLQVVQGDALEWLRAYPWTGDEFLYLDPPYLLETRSSRRTIYRHEFHSVRQHRALLEVLTSIPCPVMLSGYSSPLYQLALAGWRTLTYSNVTRGGRQAEEWLWMNYREPIELHDYGHLGEGFRERERIKRKRSRWRRRLLEMPALERHAILAAIADLRCSIAGNGEVDHLDGNDEGRRGAHRCSRR